MPVLKPFKGAVPTKLVPFHIAYSKQIYHCTVHFFIHDDQFVRIIRNPEKYLQFLVKCDSVIGPDFSQYIDMPEVFRMGMSFLNRALSYYWQENGVNLIANVTWSLSDSFGYSFTGMPHHAMIAINCNGILKCDLSKYLWYQGYRKANEELHPTLIIRYGSRMKDENEEISLYFSNERLNVMRYGRQRK